MISQFREKQAEVQRGGVAGKVTTGVWIFQLPACSFPPNTSLCIFANPTAYLARGGGAVGERRGEAGLPFSSFLTTSSNLSSQPLGNEEVREGKDRETGRVQAEAPRSREHQVRRHRGDEAEEG